MKTKSKARIAALILCTALVFGATGVMTVMAEPGIASDTDLPPITVADPVDTMQNTVEPTSDTDSDPSDCFAPADLDLAMSAMSDYARDAYGVIVDANLTPDNAMHRYPGCTYNGADQATLEAKCREIVDFTFEQFLRSVTPEQLRNAGIHCRVYVETDGDALNCYCLYA